LASRREGPASRGDEMYSLEIGIVKVFFPMLAVVSFTTFDGSHSAQAWVMESEYRDSGSRSRG
jgi:hypothetical protein